MTSSASDRSQSVRVTPSSVPPSGTPFQSEATLVDAVDHLLNRGAVLVGEATISLADIDLIYVGLNLVISSVETLRRASPGPDAPPRPLANGERKEDVGESAHSLTLSQPGLDTPPSSTSRREVSESVQTATSPLAKVSGAGEGMGPRAPTEGERPEQGLARLVLTLVELLRQILERQAVRRMEGGTLSEEDLERMGIALLELEQKMAEVREIFGLEEADLNLDLGPLGRLL